jgi:hypothetical protein
MVLPYGNNFHLLQSFDVLKSLSCKTIENLEGRSLASEGLNFDEKMILKWTGFIWHMIGSSEDGNEPFCSIKDVI